MGRLVFSHAEFVVYVEESALVVIRDELIWVVMLRPLSVHTVVRQVRADGRAVELVLVDAFIL